MIQRIALTLLLFFCVHINYAQDTTRTRFALLTIGIANEPYTFFGHTALRFTDSATNTDIVFNYGTFNFDEPAFVYKFLKGNLPYYLSVDALAEFKQQYIFENRDVIEQELNLSTNQKIAIKNYLKNNLKPENRTYFYDFSDNNCTTKIKDVLTQFTADSALQLNNQQATTTYRTNLHQYLNYQNPWYTFGFDALVGLKADVPLNANQAAFLPQNLMQLLATKSNLVNHKTNLVTATQQYNNQHWFTPFLFFTGLLLLCIALSFIKNTRVQLAINGYGAMLFFICGLMGLLVLFMWFAANYNICKQNLNVFWALPLHVFTAFFLLKKQGYKKYFIAIAILNLLFLLALFFLPQHFNTTVIPIVLTQLFFSYKKIKAV
jgi:hypothetical protein